MRLLNDGWLFALGAPREFTPVSIPHDWLIADTRRLYESGVGWYRRELDASFLKEGQRLFLRFDGVYMDSTLYVNGETAGEWKYGYTAFEHEITGLIRRNGPNTLLLRVNYQAPSDRWYTGAGIYRDVFLVTTNACRIAADGVYITTRREGTGWAYEAEAEADTGGRPYTLRHRLMGAEDGIRPWDMESPALYTLRTELFAEGRRMDAVDTRFGFRAAEFTPDRGFFLNGRPVKLHGVCLHHDLGGLGAAVWPDAIRRQFRLLRAMGVNAVRTAHNPPAKVLMEIADQMGFLVLSEFTDVWRRAKTPYDYARFFDEWSERDVAAWIRRDRNHPSVILWSVGNEIYDTHADAAEGAESLKRLMALARRFDPKENARVTFCSNYMPWENTQRCADIIKLAGYNYAAHLYGSHHASHPDWILYGGETGSTVQSRGIYHFPLAKTTLSDDDLQCSALGNSSTSWGARSVEENIRLDPPYTLGQFVWAGQDYLGEPTPYHTKNSYFGQLDTAGFPKDSYYLYQAAWTEFEESPMIHLFPYWDFSPGQLIDVRVCSNAPRVELFLDGESLGARDLSGTVTADFRVPYRPGALRAVAFDSRGGAVCEAVRHSFGDAAALRLSHDTEGDMVFTAITAVDAEGYPVENANRRVRVAVEDGDLLALDNGDATDYDPYRSDNRRLFSGKLLAIIRPHPGRSPRVTAMLDRDDIPVRKVELTADGYRIEARVFPPDANHRDLLWRLTDAGGIDSPLGRLEVAADGQSARVIPHGDGQAAVRCSPRNGRDHAAFISLLTLDITGYGKPLLNPYAFVSGGLYNASNAEMANGNERGVATLREGESHVGFMGLDFGPYGSDEMTLSLFPLDKEPFAFDIWEGMPKKGGEPLLTAFYDKGSVWNTYQETRCRLPRRLAGITGVCFVFRQKVHIKGFVFARLERAYQKQFAAECDRIYGDSFLAAPDGAMEGLAGNVTLVYPCLDFGPRGTGTVRLCWRSALPVNSMQLAFSGEAGEVRHMIELPQAGEYTDAVFQLGGRVAGAQTLSLILLPGCGLDLRWIWFQEEKPQ